MKAKTFWITLDADADEYKDCELWAYRTPPKKNAGGYYHTKGAFSFFEVCPRGLLSLTGIKMEPGQKRKFKLVEAK